MTCIHHHGIFMWSIFTALKILCALPVHLSHFLNPWQPLIFFSVHFLSNVIVKSFELLNFSDNLEKCGTKHVY